MPSRELVVLSTSLSTTDRCTNARLAGASLNVALCCEV
jgi:hypothetical protein